MFDSGKVQAMLELEDEAESFIRAVLQKSVTLETDRELLDVFVEVARHPDVGLLIKDWTRYLCDKVDGQGPQTDESNSGLSYLVSQLGTPESLKDDKHGARLDTFPTLKPGSRLWCLLSNINYVERDAWSINAQVPVEERRRLAQRVLDDIQYVEQSLGIQRTHNDELFIDENMGKELRLERLHRRIVEVWGQWHPGEIDSDGPTPSKRRRYA